MHNWMFVWMFVMFVMLTPPIGYGWGYRGWGPPYPRYIQGRRAEQAPVTDKSFDHRAWGWGGDAVWTFVLLGMLWAVFFGFWA